MPVVYAQIAGLPVEESVLALLPAAWIIIAGIRLWFQRLRRVVISRSLSPRVPRSESSWHTTTQHPPSC
jgi:hypothetical protein